MEGDYTHEEALEKHKRLSPVLMGKGTKKMERELWAWMDNYGWNSMENFENPEDLLG